MQQDFDIDGLLNQAKDQLGIDSDYRLAKMTGIAPNSISNYRNRKSLPNEKACRALASAAHIDGDVLIAEVNMVRAPDPETRAIWEEIRQRLRGVVSIVIAATISVLIAGSLMAPNQALARVSGPSDPSDFKSTNYTSYYFYVPMLGWLKLSKRRRPPPCPPSPAPVIL